VTSTVALLEARDADVAYAPGAPPTVRGATLRVDPGDTIGLVGESGSGKTTLARALVGMLHPSRGEVLVEGRPWAKVSRRDPARRAVQMVFQDPYAALNPRLRIGATVAEAVRVVRGLPRREAAQVAERILADVGVAGRMLERMPREMSGGQLQRVVIARALACEPRVLVADEPTAALDVSIQAQILGLLLDLVEEHGLGLVLVTHDLAIVRAVAATTAVMCRGELVEHAPTARVFEEPDHDYTKSLLQAYAA
jgi:ABC-type glutathione transport system ATPase component